MLTTKTRFRGAMLGLAAGDALGTTLEFRAPGTFVKIKDMVGGGPFDLKPGEWTDDTSMALCLAESLIESNGFDPSDQLMRYLQWARSGYLSSNGEAFDIGNDVRTALHRFSRRQKPICGPVDPKTAGNGSLMRLAPVPLYFSNKPDEAIHYSGESSRTTHGSQAAIDACRYFGGLIVGAAAGISKDELLGARYAPVKNYWLKHPLCPEIHEVCSGSFKRRSPPTIQGTGFVVQSLEAALWAFYRGRSFKEGCLLAVNLGDDADTTGAVYGQLAGTYYGEGGIPLAWRKKLAHRALIVSFADGLARTL